MIKPGQDKDCNVLVANYHAPNEKDNNVELLTTGYGVQNIKLQKDIFNADLYFKLLNLSKIGDLNRMTQYKSSNERDRTGQLMTYPVLMAHDVAGYEEVVVGEDQHQHIQYARKLIKKYNDVYKEDYLIPTPRIVVGRIKDLKETSKKMSKSSPEGCLFLNDNSDDIRLKLKKATTDEEGLKNLGFLYEQFVGEKIPESNRELKENLSEALIQIVEKARMNLLDEITRMSQEMGLY